MAKGLEAAGDPFASVEASIRIRARGREDTKSAATASGGVDRPLMRYSAKLGLAATLGYVVGVASHRSELGVIVWTTMIAGLRTYGATLRKMILRIVGAAIGGLLALACILVVSPNFESLASFLLVALELLGRAASLTEHRVRELDMQVTLHLSRRAGDCRRGPR